jgi:kynurenine formamidase
MGPAPRRAPAGVREPSAAGTGWTPDLLAELDRYAVTASNWGRWGDDDQLGTLNLVTPERRQAAAALVRTGACVSLGRRIGGAPQPDDPQPPLQLMKASGEAAPARGGSHASDWVGLAPHGFAVTHVDAFSHQFFDGAMYNGQPASLVTTRTGAGAGSVEAFAGGIVGRGVLLDLPAAQDRPWLEPGEYVRPADLDAAAAHQAEVRPGDILFVRVGRDARAARHGRTDPVSAGLPGLSADCVPWLRERDVAVLGCDGVSDQMTPGGAPHPMPVHAGALTLLGLPLLDNAWLEDLAVACAAEGRREFLAVICPLRLRRATGSAVNPVAVL